MTLTPVRRLLIAVLLVGVGFFVVPLLRELFPSEATWQAQIRADALSGIEVLKPWEVEELPAEFWDRWDLQLEPYDEERRGDLRGRLHLYLDFLEAEYGEAADIYVSGTDPKLVSDGVREIRARLPEAFGAVAEQMIANADELREHAFRLSPKHGGLDPDAPDFRVEAQSVREWLTVARPRVDRLTTPPDER